MPPSRRSTRSSQAGGKQATLSFHNRVTKSGAQPGKKDLISSTTPTKASPLSKQISRSEDEPVAEKQVSVEEQEDGHEDAAAAAPVEQEQEPEAPSEAELRARDITDRQISAYWNRLERERTAKRVHQQDLSLAEKVLRYFDVSSQYGPCVGMSRMKRWQRADKLGLNPPSEVLAVLMKEEEKGTKGIEAAHMDQILNSTAVGAN
ncbi:uncharacterized protein JN550_012369 [Neoarthrinium moseri]|uniref:uncharacterized protein n=1 Tax=Neoarthrinium moseri TaxID=1658444 RepID=UPI001FDAD962|nr:uncharacterized protein JN550_012369 [Neoarthrinium moseri]KAI1858910.1 hypothetical protein JN550_012369 [Neoarthrinium moseri]